MWLSEQQKRPAPTGEGRTGVVTMAGDPTEITLDHRIRDPELYGPAGYRWTPTVGDRVLVIRGEGERPCVVGVRGGGSPAEVELKAESIRLTGSVSVNGTDLDTYIKTLVRQTLEELS